MAPNPNPKPNMIPLPQITTPPLPLRQRQTVNTADPYGLSSLYAELSALESAYSYTPYSYSFDSASYYASLSAEYSALASLYSISVPIYTYPGASATAAETGKSTAIGAATTSTSSLQQTSGSKGGLSTGAKIGIGVGVPLGVAFLLGIAIFVYCAGKNKGKKSSTTIIAPPSQAQVYQQTGYAAAPQGYIPGQPTAPMNYVQPIHPGGAPVPGYAGYGKGPDPGVSEMEQEYHFARPGVVEMGDGVPEAQEQTGKKNKKGKK